MKDTRYFIVGMLALMATIFGLLAYTTNTYGKVQLRSFNKINGTHYTIDEWRTYEYDIKKLHPFSDKE